MKNIRVLLVIALLALGVTVASASPAASVPACEQTINGIMRLDFGEDPADGTGVAFWDGRLIRVSIDSSVIVDDTGTPVLLEQNWTSPAWTGDHTIMESSYQSPLFGPYIRFDSSVTVDGGAGGTMSFSGIANQGAGFAWFRFSGTLCDVVPF